MKMPTKRNRNRMPSFVKKICLMGEDRAQTTVLNALARWCCRLFLHVGWLGMDLYHGIGLQSVWHMSQISRRIWKLFWLHWSVVAFQLWTVVVCFPWTLFLCCCIWLCRLPLSSCTWWWGHRHQFVQFCNCKAEVQSLGRLGRLWVSWMDLFGRFL